MPSAETNLASSGRPLIVQKYGGSSVSTVDKIKAVARRIAGLSQTHRMVVVVSAMGDTTDDLFRMAREISDMPAERELDVLLSSGERISMALLSMALKDLGADSVSLTGSQAGLLTDESHTRARILEVRPHRVQTALSLGKIVIIAGFQGVSREKKEITTLGRGGSDTSAVAFALALKAARCEILTDVDSVCSADPRLVTSPVRYSQLPLGLVLEMACTGAQVMHARAIEMARNHNLNLWLGPAHQQSSEDQIRKGTLMSPDESFSVSELPKVVSVALRKNLSALSVNLTTEGLFYSELLASAAQNKILVHDLISTSPQDGERFGYLMVDEEESRQWLQTFLKNAQKISLLNMEKVHLFGLIGYHLEQNAEMYSRALEVFAEHGLRTALTHSTHHGLRFYLHADQPLEAFNLALRSLHDRLILG